MSQWIKPRWPTRGARAVYANMFGVLAAVSLTSCIVGDDRCGENQVRSKENESTCVCIEGAVLAPRGYDCAKCGKHEVVVNGACECASGFARPSAGKACEEVAGSTFGDACDETKPCTAPNPYCAASASGADFCTSQDCTDSSDCPTLARCVAMESPSYCARPIGLGNACMTNQDCAGTEATFCDTLVTKACAIQNCMDAENSCPNGLACCDLRAFLGTTLCVDAAAIANGMCPGGAL